MDREQNLINGKLKVVIFGLMVYVVAVLIASVRNEKLFHCDCGESGLWSIEMLKRLQSGSHIITATAYLYVPIVIVRFFNKSNIPYRWWFVLLYSFLQVNGMTHLFNAWIYVVHTLEMRITFTVVKILCAVLGCVSAIVFRPFIHPLLRLILRDYFLRTKSSDLEKELDVMKRGQEAGKMIQMIKLECRESLEKEIMVYNALRKRLVENEERLMVIKKTTMIVRHSTVSLQDIMELEIKKVIDSISVLQARIEHTCGGEKSKAIFDAIVVESFKLQVIVGMSEFGRSFQGIQVLLVDTSNPSTFYSLLQTLGCKVTSAVSGFECLGVLGDPGNWFDVVLLDLELSDIHAFDVTKITRQVYRGTWPLIVALSSSSFEDMMEKCTEVGFDGVFRKSIKLHEVARGLHKLLEQTNRRFPGWD